MKKLFSICLLVCLVASAAIAQKNEGVIHFVEKINMHRNLPPEAAEMRAMMPEFRSHQSELLFNAKESLYRNVEEEEEEMGDGRGMVIKMQRPESTFYRNFETKRKVDAREFMRKEYLIDDTLVTQNWKITGDSKKILDYNCMSAVTSDTSRKQEITAWFASDLPLPTGPSSFGLLPGTILEIDINDGELVISAQKVEFKKLKKKALKAPRNGEKTSDAEFQKMVTERMKEMGGSGPRMRRVIRN